MKLSDNTGRISDLAGQVRVFAEKKAYLEAYKALDEIVLQVCHAHSQLDDLMRNDDYSAILKKGP